MSCAYDLRTCRFQAKTLNVDALTIQAMIDKPLPRKKSTMWSTSILSVYQKPVWNNPNETLSQTQTACMRMHMHIYSLQCLFKERKRRRKNSQICEIGTDRQNVDIPDILYRIGNFHNYPSWKPWQFPVGRVHTCQFLAGHCRAQNYLAIKRNIEKQRWLYRKRDVHSNGGL